jgi:hypothetical protein
MNVTYIVYIYINYMYVCKKIFYEHGYRTPEHPNTCVVQKTKVLDDQTYVSIDCCTQHLSNH